MVCERARGHELVCSGNKMKQALDRLARRDSRTPGGQILHDELHSTRRRLGDCMPGCRSLPDIT